MSWICCISMEGSINPVLCVELDGVKKYTDIQYGTTSCTWSKVPNLCCSLPDLSFLLLVLPVLLVCSYACIYMRLCVLSRTSNIRSRRLRIKHSHSLCSMLVSCGMFGSVRFVHVLVSFHWSYCFVSPPSRLLPSVSFVWISPFLHEFW